MFVKVEKDRFRKETTNRFIPTLLTLVNGYNHWSAISRWRFSSAIVEQKQNRLLGTNLVSTFLFSF